MALDKVSLERLLTCDQRIQDVVSAVALRFPIKVLDGHRTKEQQDAACNAKPPKSQTPWPTSKHNSLPSLAVDIVPLEHIGGKEFIDWNDRERMTLLAGFMLTEGFHRGITLRWGGDWDKDTLTKDNQFDDLPHFEIVES